MITTFLYSDYSFITFCIIKTSSSKSWWDKKSNVKMNIQWLQPAQVQEIKRGRATALAERGQEVRVTAVEAFDLRVLINEDYGLCTSVSPDFSTRARRRQHSQKTRGGTSSSFLKRCSLTIPSASI